MRSEEHTSELQSQSVISYAVFCLKNGSCKAFLDFQLSTVHFPEPTLWLLVTGSLAVFAVFKVDEGFAESAAWTAEMGRMFDLGLETDSRD